MRRGRCRKGAQQAHIDWRMAHEDHDAAAHALAPLIELCRARGWQRRTVSLEVRRAVTAHVRGDADSARQVMLDAVRHGHRLGLVRTLLDAHPAALDLIGAAVRTEPQGAVLQFYADRLRSAQARATAKRPDAPGSGVRAGEAKAPEILSVRETKVLSLLAQALPNKKIARTMGISPETVKWHLKNIYSKLGVSSRDEAVARSRDLALNDGA